MSRLPEGMPFTMIPNFIFDERLGGLTGSEFALLMVIYRKTVGYDKKHDEISYSQFIRITNFSRSTISGAIESLEDQELIKVDRSGVTNRYTYCLPENKVPSDSSIIEPGEVQKSNRIAVRKLDTQKKTLKESRRNTTSSDLSDELTEVISYWNRIFSNTLDPSDSKLVKCIEEALNNLTVEKVKKAIFNRSHCSYYRDKKPQLLNKPSAFFPYPETITNDLSRNPECIFDYDEKNQRIWEKKNVDEDFEILWDRKDEEDRPLWKLSTANY